MNNIATVLIVKRIDQEGQLISRLKTMPLFVVDMDIQLWILILKLVIVAIFIRCSVKGGEGFFYFFI